MSQSSIEFNSRTPEWDWLSNFSPHPITGADGTIWPTVEHAYQAAKSTDPADHEMVRLASTPGIAKRMGSLLPLRNDWGAIKMTLMQTLLIAKFYEHADLRQKLLDTGEAELVHLAPWDNYWGSGRDGRGANVLGACLMGVRRMIQGGLGRFADFIP